MERRYLIGSIAADGKLFAHAVRCHWGIEDGLHWRMDVVLREDASRIRKGTAPAIMTSIRHLILNLFQKGPSKLSKAAWDEDFRYKVLFS